MWKKYPYRYFYTKKSGNISDNERKIKKIFFFEKGMEIFWDMLYNDMIEHNGILCSVLNY